MTFNTLTTTLSNFINAFEAGYSNLLPSINWLVGTLLAIEIILLGFWWALSGQEQLAQVIKKILFLGFWLWIVGQFPVLAKQFVNSLTDAGFIAGGKAPGNHNLLLDPSHIAGYGIDATRPLVEKLNGIKWDVVDAIIIGLSYIGIMIAFLIVAIQIFLTVLEYYLILALSGILLPFGFLQHTKFLAEKAIGAVIAAGIKLMVLAFIIAVTEPVLSSISFSGEEIEFNEIWSVFLTSWAIAFLAWNAPGIVAGLLSGSPSLSAGTGLQNAVATGVLGGAALYGATSATRAAASGASATAAKSIQLGSSVHTGARLATSTSTGNRIQQAGRAIQGGAQALVGQITKPLQEAGSSIKASAEQHASIGARQGYVATGGTLSLGMQQAQMNDVAGTNHSAKNAPKWAQRAMHTLHNIPQESRPMGGTVNPKL